jgi:hypothetical protein
VAQQSFGRSLAGAFSGLGSQISTGTARKVVSGAAPGRGALTYTPPPDVLSDLEDLIARGGDLAKLMVREMAMAAIGALEAADSSVQYGVRETIAALRADAANPIELVSDPAQGIFWYGAGRIGSSDERGSAPEGPIATFLRQFRAGKSAPGGKSWWPSGRRRAAGRAAREAVPRVENERRRQARLRREAHADRMQRAALAQAEIHRLKAEIASGALSGKQVGLHRTMITMLTTPLPLKDVQSIASAVAKKPKKGMSLGRIKYLKPGRPGAAVAYARALKEEIYLRGGKDIELGALSLAHPQYGERKPMSAARDQVARTKALRRFGNVAGARIPGVDYSYDRRPLEGRVPGKRYRRSQSSVLGSRIRHLGETPKESDAIVRRLATMIPVSEYEYRAGPQGAIVRKLGARVPGYGGKQSRPVPGKMPRARVRRADLREKSAEKGRALGGFLLQDQAFSSLAQSLKETYHIPLAGTFDRIGQPGLINLRRGLQTFFRTEAPSDFPRARELYKAVRAHQKGMGFDELTERGRFIAEEQFLREVHIPHVRQLRDQANLPKMNGEQYQRFDQLDRDLKRLEEQARGLRPAARQAHPRLSFKSESQVRALISGYHDVLRALEEELR